MFVIYPKMLKQNQYIITYELVQTWTPEIVYFPNQGVIA